MTATIQTTTITTSDVPTLFWLSVSDIAETAGFSYPYVYEIRTQLGKHVANWYRDNFYSEPKTEMRTINGKEYPMFVYEPTQAVLDVVISFLTR